MALPATPCLVNGRPGAYLENSNRGLAYGDGLFETILLRNGQALWLDQHLQRLQAGARRLHIPCPLALLARECAQLMEGATAGEAVLKIILCRGAGGRAYQPAAGPSERIIMLMPAPPADDHWRDGVRLALCSTRLAQQPSLAGIKHLNRLEQVLAADELRARGFSEGLMQGSDGAVVEGTRSNLFVAVKGKLLTPLLSQYGVAGIMRQQILRACQQQDIVCNEGRLTLADLQAAEELFVCNSVFGIWPVVALECLQKEIGPLSRQLQSVFKENFCA